MTDYEPGDIALVPFPFSDLIGAKKRPVLVLTVLPRELVCLMLTASPSGHNEVPVRQWKEAGLLRPTVARVHRLFAIESALVFGRLGRMEAEDYREVLAATVAVLIRGKT
jgi:mRNA interferase MazF